MYLRKSIMIASALGAAALLSATQAAAHAKMVSSNPVANATVAAPKIITLKFDEALTPAFSGFELSMGDGMKMAVKVKVSKDHRTITGVPQGALMAGAYKLTWHATTVDDGHRVDGTFAFTVK